MYYSYNKLMSYNGLFNFVLSGRGNGKSFGAKKIAIDRFLKNKEQFIYLRRYKSELKKKNLFFDDIAHLYPNIKFKIEGNTMLINKEICGYFVPLSTANIEKSTPFPNVTTIIFDEFIIEKGLIRQLPNEVETFLNLYETVNRMREYEGRKPCKVFFLGNKISIINPYFIYFNCIPQEDKEFSTFKNGNIIIHQFKSTEFIEEKYKTRFGQLIKGTEFGDFSIENTSLRDNTEFVLSKKPKGIKFLFSIIYKGKELGIWISYKEGIIYVSEKVDQTSNNRFALTKEDMTINFLMFDKLTNLFLFKEVIKYFKNGLVRFSSIKVKYLFYDVVKITNN